ncbi:MAG: hypothetical protein NTX04_05755 [Verrucomicrobia bacterium]|nr:hypothetical protein [Verrucomicrobiota bacterium]
MTHRASTLPSLILTLALLAINPNALNASAVGEVVERLARLSEHFIDDAGRVAAREAMEVAIAKHGAEVVELAERGGFGLAEAATRHGDEVWKLARLCPEAPAALGARAESIMAITRRWGENAAVLEIKAPGCGELLAGRLSKSALHELAEKGTAHEISRMSALAVHQSPAEVNAALSIWKRGGAHALEFLTPSRIAATGFAVAVIVAAYHAPDAVIGIADTALRGLLGPVLTVASWALCVVILVLLRRPMLWLVRRAASLARQAWKSIQGDGLQP